MSKNGGKMKRLIENINDNITSLGLIVNIGEARDMSWQRYNNKQ